MEETNDHILIWVQLSLKVKIICCMGQKSNLGLFLPNEAEYTYYQTIV